MLATETSKVLLALSNLPSESRSHPLCFVLWYLGMNYQGTLEVIFIPVPCFQAICSPLGGLQRHRGFPRLASAPTFFFWNVIVRAA